MNELCESILFSLCLFHTSWLTAESLLTIKCDPSTATFDIGTLIYPKTLGSQHVASTNGRTTTFAEMYSQSRNKAITAAELLKTWHYLLQHEFESAWTFPINQATLVASNSVINNQTPNLILILIYIQFSIFRVERTGSTIILDVV